MNKSDIIGIVVALAVLLSVPAIPLISTIAKGEMILEREVSKPSSRTVNTAIATFALG